MSTIEFLIKVGFERKDSNHTEYVILVDNQIWVYDMGDYYWANISLDDLFLVLADKPQYEPIYKYLCIKRRILFIDDILSDLNYENS